MRNPVISPRFEEDAYQGKDIVHEGIRIPLQRYVPLDLLARFSKKAQQKIVKAPQENGITYEELESGHLGSLRAMWFDPMDETFPTTMEGHTGILARLNNQIIGGVIWAYAASNLFLHQLVAGEEGKKLHLPTLLIWQSVLKYTNRSNSLDIGVSYNPKRYEFFKHFAVETYPIILRKPFYTPVIRLAPFRGFSRLKAAPDQQPDYQGMEMTFLPRASYAVYAALKHIGVGPGDHVQIVKTFDTPFITGCVTQPIERAGAEWGLYSSFDNPKAVIAIHEFGVPISDPIDTQWLKTMQRNGVPIIEDCAWRDSRVWDWSDYQVFSLQKMYDINYGGILKGVHLTDDYLWSIGCLDSFKRARIAWEEEKDIGEGERIRNWWAYHNLVLADGMTPDDRIAWEQAVKDGWIPTVYMQRFESDEVATAIVDRLEEFGIQAGRYWPEPVAYLPIHQNMSEEETRYMFAVVRGYFNLCRGFQ